MQRERIQLGQRKTKVQTSVLEEKVLEGVEKGKLYIPIEKILEEDEIPDRYVQQAIKLGRDSYNVLIPKKILYFIGYPEDATDELLECYNQIREVENELMKKRNFNAAESYFAQGVKNAYEIYMLNQIIKNGMLSNEAKQIFSKAERRIEAMLGILGCETKTDLKDLNDILMHVTTTDIKGIKTIEEQIAKEVPVYETTTYTETITCDCGSHYEYRQVQKQKTEFVGTKTVYETIRKNVVAIMDNVVFERAKEYHELEKETLKEIFGGNREKGKEYIDGINKLRTYLNLYLEKANKTRLPLIFENK